MSPRPGQPSAGATHAREPRPPETRSLSQTSEIACGVGRSTVAVKDHALDLLAAAAHRGGDLDRVHAQEPARVLPDRAGEQPARVQVDHGGEVELALAGEGKLYLCAIKDCYSNRIVGYSIDSRMKARLAVAALDNAVARRRVDGASVAGCIVHADRGSQFRSRKFHRTLTRQDMVGLMGQVASAADNAAMESFFSLLQKNVLNRQPWRTRDALRIAIVTWIERTYHRRRGQAPLGRLTPIEWETIMTNTAAYAA